LSYRDLVEMMAERGGVISQSTILRFGYSAMSPNSRGGDLLAHGIDPSALKTALGKHRFGVTMREWEAEQGRMHGGIYLCPVCGVSNPSIPKQSNDIRNCARESAVRSTGHVCAPAVEEV
jgi:hypothetical protein